MCFGRAEGESSLLHTVLGRSWKWFPRQNLEKVFFSPLLPTRVYKHQFKGPCKKQTLDFLLHPIYYFVPLPGHSTQCFMTSMIWRPETLFLGEGEKKRKKKTENVAILSESATDFSVLYTHGSELGWNSNYGNNKQIWVRNVHSLITRNPFCQLWH